jgi:phage tail-like protein
MRGHETDYYHNFRFHVIITGPHGEDYVGSGISGGAGFNTCSTPQITLESVEYREGIWTYTRKFPGIPTVDDVTLGRGVTRTETPFYNWAIKAIEGGQYRATMTIYHFHRVGKEPQEGLPRSADEFASARKLICLEALPIRFKPATDLDATSSDISIMEMDVACERFKIEAPTGPANLSGWNPSEYLSL